MKNSLLGMAMAMTMMATATDVFPRQAQSFGNPGNLPKNVNAGNDPARISADEIINEAPAGKTTPLAREGESYKLVFDFVNISMSLDLVSDQYVTGEMVEGEDGYFYFRNPVPGYAAGAYMKGEREGDEIVFSFPQPIVEIDGLLMGVSKMTLFDDPLLGVNARVVDQDNEVRFSINEDGSYTQIMEEGCLLGYYYVDDGSWSYIGNLSQTCAPFDEKEVSLPAGVEPVDGQLIYGTDGKRVDIAVDGDSFYLGGFYGDVSGYAVGTISGNQVTFPSYQYIGASEESSHYIFFAAARTSDLDADLDAAAIPSMVFDYDADSCTLTPAGSGESIVANASAREIYWLEYFDNPKVSPFILQPATPRNPYITGYEEDWSQGYAILEFVMASTSVDDNYLAPDCYFYNVYLDDEVLELYPDEYAGISEVITDIPCDFNNNEQIYTWNGKWYVYIYSEGHEKVGVQTLYVVDGVEHRSDIVYYDPNGIDSVAGEGSPEVSVAYYDMTGRRVQHPAEGMFIRRGICEDGSSRTSKICVK